MGAMMLHSAPQRLPWSAVQAWCDRARLGPEDREDLAMLLTTMDTAYLEWWGRQNPVG